MGIHIECDEKDVVVVQVIGGSATKEAAFNRRDWFSCCGCIVDLLMKLLEQDRTVVIYQKALADLRKLKTQTAEGGDEKRNFSVCM